MNPIKRIAKNIFSLFAGHIISAILTVLLSIYIARFLGATLFGRYSFAIAFVMLFSIFIDLGYETLLIREVAKNNLKANEYINNIIIIRAFFSFLIFLTIYFTINYFGYPDNIKNLIYLFGLSEIFISFSNIFRVTFRAFERMEFEALISVFTNIFRCSLGIFLLFTGYGLIHIALVFLFSALIDFVINVFICEKKILKTKTQFDKNFFKDTIRIALPIGIVAIFSLVYVKIDTVMLAALKTETVVGWYNAAYNLILGFSPIPHLIMHALLPFMAYSYVKSKKTLADVYEKSFKFLFLLGLPITIGIFLLADRFIILFYGNEFLNSITALKVLSWDILIKFLYLCIWFVLISIDKQKQLAIVAGLGALINISLNLFLIPKYSLVGAAIATIITELVILILFLYLTYKNDLKIGFNRILIKPFIACAAMALFVYFLNKINLYYLIIISIIIYFGIFYLIKGLTEDEVVLIKNLLKRN